MGARIISSKARRGLCTINVEFDAGDLFSERERFVMNYILQRTPPDLRKEIGNHLNVTDERVVQIITKILKKLNEVETEES